MININGDQIAMTTRRPARVRGQYRRATFSLPPDLARNLPRLAKRLRVSQSAVVSELLREPVAAMMAVFDELPPAPTSQDVLRARGKSLELLQDIIDDASQLAFEEARK